MKTPAYQEEPSDGGRRRLDDYLIQAWQDQFDELRNQVAELSQTVRGFNGTKGVMERLTGIETEIQQIHELLKPKAIESTDEKKGITKDQLASMILKLASPVLTAVVIWVLLTLFPQLIIHLGTP